MGYRVKTNYDRGYVNAMDKVRVFIESNQKVMYVNRPVEHNLSWADPEKGLCESMGSFFSARKMQLLLWR